MFTIDGKGIGSASGAIGSIVRSIRQGSDPVCIRECVDEVGRNSVILDAASSGRMKADDRPRHRTPCTALDRG